MEIHEWGVRYATLLRRYRVAIVGMPLSMLISAIIFGVGAWYFTSEGPVPSDAAVLTLAVVGLLPVVAFIVWLMWHYGRRPHADRRPWDDPDR